MHKVLAKNDFICEPWAYSVHLQLKKSYKNTGKLTCDANCLKNCVHPSRVYSPVLTADYELGPLTFIQRHTSFQSYLPFTSHVMNWAWQNWYYVIKLPCAMCVNTILKCFEVLTAKSCLAMWTGLMTLVVYVLIITWIFLTFVFWSSKWGVACLLITVAVRSFANVSSPVAYQYIQLFSSTLLGTTV